LYHEALLHPILILSSILAVEGEYLKRIKHQNRTGLCFLHLFVSGTASLVGFNDELMLKIFGEVIFAIIGMPWAEPVEGFGELLDLPV